MSQSSQKRALQKTHFGMSSLVPYLGGVGAWFANMGLQFVMIPTFVVIVMGGSAGDLALAQIAMSLPQLFLLIYAGGIADRSNGRTLTVLVHLLATIPTSVLAWVVWSGAMAYWHIIIYAVCVGILSAFAAPTRDAMLTRVSGNNVHNTVMMSLFTQFTAQLIGFSLAGLAAPVAGPWALPTMQVAVILVGLLCALLLPNIPPLVHRQDAAPDGTDDPMHDRGWRTGYYAISRSQKLYPVMLATVAVGVLFIGIFMVSLPLIVREIFNGGQLEISILNFCFWGGTITSTLVLLVRRPIHRRGLAMTGALVVGSISLLAMTYAPNFIVFCALASCWGLAAGVNMVTSRTIVQIEAPEQSRARVMAFYNLGFLGAAPLGAFFVGQTAELIGPLPTMGLFASFMLMFTLWLVLATPVLAITRHEDE